MSVFEGDWKSVPEAVEWATQMKAWVDIYGICEFVSTDNGFEGGFAGTDDPKVSTLDSSLVWTVSDSEGQEIITPGFEEGDWGSGGVLGWYIASQPWSDGDQEFYSARFLACPECSTDPSEQCELGEACEDGTIFMYLNQTDFEIHE